MGNFFKDVVQPFLLPAYSLFVEPQRKAQKAAKEAQREQQEAQRQATAQAAAEQRRQAMAMRRERENAPNAAALLAGETAAAGAGAGSTLLTGLGGVANRRLPLGRNTLLGG